MKKKEQDGKPEKKKEEKIIYIDDGSTIADMSATHRGKEPKQKSTAREKMRTFFTVMRKMIVPLLCTLLAFSLIYVGLLALTGKL